MNLLKSILIVVTIIAVSLVGVVLYNEINEPTPTEPHTVVFPTIEELTYGDKLSSATLVGGSKDYGTFTWEDKNIIPTVINTGYKIIFTPNAEAVKLGLKTLEFTMSVKVNAKQLTWNEDGTIADKTYDGTTSATAEIQPTLNGVIEGDIVLIQYGTVAYEHPNAGDNSIISSDYGIYGDVAKNYIAPIAQPVFPLV